MNAPSPTPTTTPAPWVSRADAALAPTYVRPSMVFVSGQGCWLTDEAGERWLDMTSGVAVNALGHGAPEVAAVLREHAAGLVHTSNLFHTRPAIELAERLVAASFADKVFFCNSGAEAVEGAIKFARLAGGEGRHEIVSFRGAFHGRTLGALACTDRPGLQEAFRPLAGGTRFLPWDDEAAFDQIGPEVAGVFVEPIQGEGGLRVPRDAWLRALRARCDEVGALLMFDEVQTGLGRTGHLFAYQASGVVPDVMTLAKPLANGLPMGAVLLGPRAAAAVTPSCHATTFGGGPLVARVACAVFDRVSAPGFLEMVRARGRFLRERLEALGSPHIQEVRGRGLLMGVRTDLPVPAVTAAARDQRLLVVGAGDGVLRILPPLTVREDELADAVVRLGSALDAAAAGGAS